MRPLRHSPTGSFDREITISPVSLRYMYEYTSLRIPCKGLSREYGENFTLSANSFQLDPLLVRVLKGGLG